MAPAVALRTSPLVCRPVGWLVCEHEDCKIVAPHISAEHREAPLQGNGVMAIPTRGILHTVDLDMPASATSSSSTAPE
jgi:hypothetical protein